MDDIDSLKLEVKRLKALVGSGFTEYQMDILFALGNILHNPITKETRAQAIEYYYRIMDFAKYKGQ